MTEVTSTTQLGQAIARSAIDGSVLVMAKIEGQEHRHCLWSKQEYGTLLAQDEEGPSKKIWEACGGDRESEVHATWGAGDTTSPGAWTWVVWLGKEIGHRLWRDGVSLHTTGICQSPGLPIWQASMLGFRCFDLCGVCCCCSCTASRDVCHITSLPSRRSCTAVQLHHTPAPSDMFIHPTRYLVSLLLHHHACPSGIRLTTLFEPHSAVMHD